MFLPSPLPTVQCQVVNKYNWISMLWSIIYFKLKERQHFNSFKAMYNCLYTLNFTLITRRVALVELVRRMVVHKVSYKPDRQGLGIAWVTEVA